MNFIDMPNYPPSFFPFNWTYPPWRSGSCPSPPLEEGFLRGRKLGSYENGDIVSQPAHISNLLNLDMLYADYCDLYSSATLIVIQGSVLIYKASNVHSQQYHSCLRTAKPTAYSLGLENNSYVHFPSMSNGFWYSFIWVSCPQFRNAFSDDVKSSSSLQKCKIQLLACLGSSDSCHCYL